MLFFFYAVQNTYYRIQPTMTNSIQSLTANGKSIPLFYSKLLHWFVSMAIRVPSKRHMWECINNLWSQSVNSVCWLLDTVPIYWKRIIIHFLVISKTMNFWFCINNDLSCTTSEGNSFNFIDWNTLLQKKVIKFIASIN